MQCTATRLPVITHRLYKLVITHLDLHTSRPKWAPLEDQKKRKKEDNERKETEMYIYIYIQI